MRRRDDRSAAAANAVKSATADLAPPTTGGVRSRRRRHRPRRRLRSSIRRALRTDDQVPSPITDLQAAVDDAIAALDRLERAVKPDQARTGCEGRRSSRPGSNHPLERARMPYPGRRCRRGGARRPGGPDCARRRRGCRAPGGGDVAPGARRGCGRQIASGGGRSNRVGSPARRRHHNHDSGRKPPETLVRSGLPKIRYQTQGGNAERDPEPGTPSRNFPVMVVIRLSASAWHRGRTGCSSHRHGCCSRGRNGGHGTGRWNVRASRLTAGPAPFRDGRSRVLWRCARSFRAHLPDRVRLQTSSHRNGMTRMWRLTLASSSASARLTPLRSRPSRRAQIAADAPGSRQVDAMLPGERNTDEQAEYGAPMVPAIAARRPAMLE